MTDNTPQAYDKLIRDFAAHIGLDGDALLKTQELVIDDLAIGLACEGAEGVSDVLYFVDVGAPSPQRVPEVYRTLLQANHLWAGTGGATLGLQIDTGHVILSGRIDLKEATPEGLAAMLDGFADTGQFWKQFVAGELELDEAPGISQGLRI